MAITRDTGTTFTYKAAATSHTLSHDGGSGSDRCTVFAVYCVDLNILCNSLTYGGVSATKIAEVTRGDANRYISLWYLAGSATGANDIVASFSGSTRSYLAAVTLSGVDQTTPLDDSDSFSDNTADTTSEFSMTASVSGCWPVGYIIHPSGSASGDAPDANSAQIFEFDIHMLIESATTPLASSGAVSIGTTHASTASGGVAGLFKPAGGAPAATFTPRVMVY